MPNDQTQLAPRSKLADALRSSRHMIFTPAGHQAQYVIDRTALGEFAIYWTAEWLAGMFSMVDLPPEWVAFVQASIRGGWEEFVYTTTSSAYVPFSQVLWDEAAAAAQERRLATLVFSRVELDAQDLPDPFREIIDAVMAAEVNPAAAAAATAPEPSSGNPRKLRPHPRRALPDHNSTTL